MHARHDRTADWTLALLLGIAGSVLVVFAPSLQALYQSESNGHTQQTESASALEVEKDGRRPPSHHPGDDRQNVHSSRSVPGQLIVKYKDSVTESVASLVKHKKAFKLATTDSSDSLDKLHAKYQVKAANPIFRTEAEEAKLPGRKLADLKKHHADRVAKVKAKFTQRTKRAPKDAVIPDLSHVYLLEVPEETDIDTAVAELAQDPHIAYAQPNYLAEALWVPNDPYYFSSGSWGQGYEDLWGLKTIQAGPAWDLSKGAGVVVAVVDTGLDYNHPDIAANVWTNPGEILGNGRDDDVNGFIDDARGWDFAYEDNDPMDGHGHGTHVSGTIAAVGNNSLGIIGVAPQAKIMAVKGLHDGGSGASAWLADSLRYAADNGADVINNSWGCGSCPSVPLYDDAVRYAHSLGTVIVFAAGNSNDDVLVRSPQNQRETIVVSAFDHNDQKADFSSFGFKVDVAAPGGDSTNSSATKDYRNILSLRASGTDLYGDGASIVPQPNGAYYRARGTSMAAPHVAGLAALILARHPAFTNEDVRRVLRSSADDVGSPGIDPYAGAGRINAAKAVATDSVLNVHINSPALGVELSSQHDAVLITGTATGSTFQRYELFAAPQSDTPSWTPVGPARSIPADAGPLGSWQVHGLPTGIYLLRLLATTWDNHQFDDLVQVVVQRYPNAPVTTAPQDQRNPAVSSSRIVWVDYRNDPAGVLGKGDIYLYDRATHTERPIKISSFDEYSPAISGDRIVWIEYHPFASTLYLYDLTTNTERQLPIVPSSKDSAVISGDRMVWQDHRNGNWD
ncbi:MAG: S8 family serine peptidase, partial [Candidatus Omnitrophota bacterium]|nr:S8 family serine peptidase [Candidatus Omnitrophota bacterium]